MLADQIDAHASGIRERIRTGDQPVLQPSLVIVDR